MLTALRARKGKLLIYHGASDPVFSVNDSARWLEKLQHNLGASGAADVARLFAVPGMGHCQAGPATDRFDALGALVDWVEKGQAPERIVATLNPANKDVPAAWPATRSRPLCPYPLVARYAGGDTEAAASFRCAAP
jgi:feruloyl esterase